MSYNLAGIRKRVLVDKLDDDEFDPEVVDNFINDTLRSIYNQFELPFQEKIFQGTIPAGSTMFRLPSDLAQLQGQSLGGGNISGAASVGRFDVAIGKDQPHENRQKYITAYFWKKVL